MRGLLISMLLLMASAAHAQEGSFKEIFKEYKLECRGGRVYSNCDKADGLNQLTLFQAAVKEAQKENKLVLLEIGADWCGACVLHEIGLISRPDLLKRLDELFVRVKLNGPTNSGKQFIINRRLPVTAIPAAFIYSPRTDRFSTNLDPAVVGVESYTSAAEAQFPRMK